MTLIKSISGIRGTIGGKAGENLTPVDMVLFASAYGTWLKAREVPARVVVGRDGRISGEMVSQLVCRSLQALGIEVIDLGLSTTPTVEMAVVDEAAGGGIVITASHNPIEWNALKLLNEKGEFLDGVEGAKVLNYAEQGAFDFVPVQELGAYVLREGSIEKHVQHILNLELVDVEAIRKRDFRVVVDCINSTGALAIPVLLDALGVQQYTLLNADDLGNFAHKPEPLPENLEGISKAIKEQGADVGIVVDPDVDRLALVCEDGSMFGEEYTLVAMADFVLAKQPGNTVSNLSSSRALRDVTEAKGQQHFASAVGEVNVVKKMKSESAVIGGEGNGGVIYPGLHYGRDALVGIAFFLSHLAQTGKTCKELRASYPDYYISKNKIQLTPSIDVDGLLAALQAHYAEYPHSMIDGLKVDFPEEWIHIRKSNTEPIIRIYCEAASKEQGQALFEKVETVVKSILSQS